MTRAAADAERRAVLAEAEEHGELLALAKRAAGAGTWDLDIRNGAVRYCPRSLEMLGHSPDRATTLTAAEWAQHIYPGDAERVLAEGKRARDNRSDFITEYRIVKPDGGIRWIRGFGRTLFDDEGEAVRCVGFNFDVTAEKEAEVAFRRLQAELAQASRANAMATMAEALAHELNQPLTAISLYLSGARTLLARLPADQTVEVREAFGHVIEAAQRAGETIRNLRALNRRISDAAGTTNLRLAIGKAIDLALGDAAERGIALQISLEPDLLIDVDDLQIRQLVYNLLCHAVEASEGCTNRKIAVSSRRRGGNAVVRVEDSGRGISEADTSRLFDPFTTAGAGSAAAGLAIARTIAEFHGGRIWVEHLETGTALCAAIPLATEAPAASMRAVG